MDMVTLGTFNCENLFARYQFRSGLQPVKENGFTVNDVAFDFYGDPDKLITAKAIEETDADVLALQEVESLHVLDEFIKTLPGSAGYTYRVSIHGNDQRNIDIAILSRLPVTRLRTWRHTKSQSGSLLFSRDLLEADIEVPVGGGQRRTLTLFVNHLKSMVGGRAQTRGRRLEQVHELVHIVNDRAGPSFDGNFVVLGDMNDYLEEDGDGTKTALGELAGHPYLVNANDVLPPEQRWTHYFAGHNEYRQLDYLWVGRPFCERAGGPSPVVHRKGLPQRAKRYADDRFGGVGYDRPKASDHCPVTLTVPVSALV